MTTRSPAERVFTSAASMAPVPDAGYTTTGRDVTKTDRIRSSTSRGQARELGTAVIDDRLVHRAQHAVRDVGRTWNL